MSDHELAPQGRAVQRDPTWLQLTSEAGMTPQDGATAPPITDIDPAQLSAARRVQYYQSMLILAIEPEARYLIGDKIGPWVTAEIMAGRSVMFAVTAKGEPVPPRDHWLYRVSEDADRVFETMHPMAADALAAATGARIVEGLELTVFDLTMAARALVLFQMDQDEEPA